MDAESDYTYLNLPSDSLRLLQLYPGSPNEPLSCSLFAAKLSTSPPYEAISYVWGSSQQLTTIQCSNAPLQISQNLKRVLHRLRLPDQPRTLWVDAICINQKNESERENQVRAMGHIFSSAKRVVAWIGEGDGAENSAVELIRKMNDRFEKLARTCGSLKAVPPLTAEEIASTTDSDLQAWKSIKKMLDSSLFSRVWIIQELGLGINVLLLFGAASIEWIKLVQFCDTIRWKAVSLVNTLDLYPFRVWNTYRVYATNQQLKTLFEYKQPRPIGFLEVLISSRDHEASDQRDRIYALLGHPGAFAGGELVVQPDYTKSTNEVYCEVAMKLVQKSKSFAILSAVEHEEGLESNSALPSWVPRWSKPSRCLTLGIRRRPYYSAAPKQEGCMTLDQDRKVLTVRGMEIDTITASSDELSWEELRLNTGTQLPKSGASRFEFLSKIYPPPNPHFQHEGSSFNTLITTLTAGLHDTSPLRQSNPKSLHQHQADFAAYWHQIHGDLELPIQLSPQLQASLKASTPTGDPQRFEENLSACNGRKLFRTEEGYIGLGPRSLREGDLCCVLFGARVPILLRRVGDGYLLVGEGYLHEFMWGKAVKMLRDGELKLQEYELH